MKQYIKPQTAIVNVNFEQHLLAGSEIKMNVNTTETHSATESFSRGEDGWDED